MVKRTWLGILAAALVLDLVLTAVGIFMAQHVLVTVIVLLAASVVVAAVLWRWTEPPQKADPKKTRRYVAGYVPLRGYVAGLRTKWGTVDLEDENLMWCATWEQAERAAARLNGEVLE